MRIEPLEIELACDEEYHRAHGVDVGVTPRFTFGRLEQTIERFEEAVGLPSVSPRHDAVAIIRDRPRIPLFSRYPTARQFPRPSPSRQ